MVVKLANRHQCVGLAIRPPGDDRNIASYSVSISSARSIWLFLMMGNRCNHRTMLTARSECQVSHSRCWIEYMLMKFRACAASRSPQTGAYLAFSVSPFYRSLKSRNAGLDPEALVLSFAIECTLSVLRFFFRTRYVYSHFLSFDHRLSGALV